jgi:hypothetical protein
MYFSTKNYLKTNHYYIDKHTLNLNGEPTIFDHIAQQNACLICGDTQPPARHHRGFLFLILEADFNALKENSKKKKGFTKQKPTREGVLISSPTISSTPCRVYLPNENHNPKILFFLLPKPRY